jgi:Flp pilus assembly CpaE family ATPase
LLAGAADIDVLVVSSTFNAVPIDALRQWCVGFGRLVVCAPDPAADRWGEFPCPVIGLEADSHRLGQALETALGGQRRRPAARKRTSQRQHPADEPTVSTPQGEILAVCSAEDPAGRSTVAVSLAVCLSLAADTVLIDANERGSGVEYQLVGVDPLRNLCQVARADPVTPAEWHRAMSAELQPMGEPGRGQVLLGATRPTLRPLLTAEAVSAVLDLCQERFRFTVVDTSGSGWAVDNHPVARLVLERADRLLLVVRPDVQGMARALRVLRDWPRHDSVQVLLNQVGLPGQRTVAQVESRLAAPVVAVLPFDARRLATARARERPIVCEPGSKLAEPLLDLAARFVGGGPLSVRVDEVATPPPAWWHRLAVAVTGAIRG